MSKVIGLGAAGNKAVVEAIKAGVIAEDSCLLINSTMSDIPAGFHDIAVDIGGDRGGCGKEREVGKSLAALSLGEEDGTLDVLDTLLDPSDEHVYLVASTEGGTGSGSISVIAAYFKHVYNVNVNITAFTGFNEDARGLLNTVDFFKDLSEEYVVQVISNNKFLNEVNGNKIAAQNLANQEFVNRLRISLGSTIVDGDNNIDNTDLFKVLSTPGFMTIESAVIDNNIKNVDQFNYIVSNMIDNTRSIDVKDPQATRIAVILDINPDMESVIDYSFKTLKDKIGVPFELFTHVQNDAEEKRISVIASGMRLPSEEVQELYKMYVARMEKIEAKSDSFFDNLSKLDRGNTSKFDTAKKTVDHAGAKRKKSDFLKSLGATTESSSFLGNSENIEKKKDEFFDKVNLAKEGKESIDKY